MLVCHANFVHYFGSLEFILSRTRCQHLFFIFSLWAFSAGIGIADESGRLDGVWQTKGYGYLFVIAHGKVGIYEQTDISCLPSGLTAGVLNYFTDKPWLAEFPVSIPGFIDANMQLFSSNSVKSILLHRTDTNSYIEATRIELLPKRCFSEEEVELTQSYLVFKQNFAEHYPFFKDKAVSWHDDHPVLTNAQTLYQSLLALVQPLADPHIAIVAPEIEGYYFGHEELSQHLPEKNLGMPLTAYCRGQLKLAVLEDKIGYLQINSFSGYSEQGDYEHDLEVLNRALDNIIPQLNQLNGLILDVSQNAGGSDKLAIIMAGRLSANDYFAYNKQAVRPISEALEWTTARPTWVEGTGVNAYQGAIVLITGKGTISAGETFTMAMMERTPEVFRVGQSTRGAFSDMLPRTLPNGWLFALPNERYLDTIGNSYDISGIPPTIEAATWTISLDKATQLLKDRHSTQLQMMRAN